LAPRLFQIIQRRREHNCCIAFEPLRGELGHRVTQVPACVDDHAIGSPRAVA
jgi:hypothetical protein